MHETGLIRGLVRATRAAAGGGRVVAVGVRVGALAGISAQHLREHWEEELRGTEVEGAALTVEPCEDPADDHATGVVLAWVEVSSSTLPPRVGRELA